MDELTNSSYSNIIIKTTFNKIDTCVSNLMYFLGKWFAFSTKKEVLRSESFNKIFVHIFYIEFRSSDKDISLQFLTSFELIY